jgi:hypothetical protein
MKQKAHFIITAVRSPNLIQFLLLYPQEQCKLKAFNIAQFGWNCCQFPAWIQNPGQVRRCPAVRCIAAVGYRYYVRFRCVRGSFHSPCAVLSMEGDWYVTWNYSKERLVKSWSNFKLLENAFWLRCILRLRLASYCRKIYDLSSIKESTGHVLYLHRIFCKEECQVILQRGINISRS